MNYTLRPAQPTEANRIWDILRDGIQRRKADGSNQWQDGYPNPDIVRSDIEQGNAYVLTDGSIIVGYCAVLINDEPEYARLQGKWLTEGDFVVFHRVAIAEEHLRKGLALCMLQHIEAFARQRQVYSIKADTNFDNPGMLHLFEKLGYTYCGEVTFRGTPRKAFEKVLVR